MAGCRHVGDSDVDPSLRSSHTVYIDELTVLYEPYDVNLLRPIPGFIFTMARVMPRNLEYALQLRSVR